MKKKNKVNEQSLFYLNELSSNDSFIVYTYFAIFTTFTGSQLLKADSANQKYFLAKFISLSMFNSFPQFPGHCGFKHFWIHQINKRHQKADVILSRLLKLFITVFGTLWSTFKMFYCFSTCSFFVWLFTPVRLS